MRSRGSRWLTAEKIGYVARSKGGSDLAFLVLSLGTIALFFFFLFLPISTITRRAFWDEQGFTTAYIKLFFRSQEVFPCVKNSLLIAVTTTLCTVFIAFPLALLNTRSTYPGQALCRALILTSMFLPPFVGTIGIHQFFSGYGTINMLLKDLGIINVSISFLSSGTIFPVILIQALHLYPMMYLSLHSALRYVDPTLEEVGTTLGISPWRQYKDIVWPLVRPGFLAGFITVFIWSLTDLGTPLMLGFHQVLPVYIYDEIRDIDENPYAYVVVFFVMLFTTGVAVAMRALFRVDSRHKRLSKTYSKRRVHRLSTREKRLLYPLLVLLFSCSFMPHLAVLVKSIEGVWVNTYLPTSFSLLAYKNLAYGLAYTGLRNSLCYALLATAISTVVGSFLAYVIAKRLTPMTSLIEMIVMAPLTLPGIVLSFGLFMTYLGTPLDPREHSPVPLLIMAYTVRYSPYIISATLAGLQQMNPNLEEAALVFGFSPFRILVDITFSAVRTHLLGGAILFFSRAMLEVSSSLILTFDPAYFSVSKVICKLYDAGGTGQAEASALGISIMVFIGVVILLRNNLLSKDE